MLRVWHVSWDMAIASLKSGLATVRMGLLAISTSMPSEVKCSSEVLSEVLETARVALRIYNECTKQQATAILKQMFSELRKCENIECVKALLDEYEEIIAREPQVCY